MKAQKDLFNEIVHATLVQSEKKPLRNVKEANFKQSAASEAPAFSIGLSDVTRLQGNAPSEFKWSHNVWAHVHRNSIVIYKVPSGQAERTSYLEQTKQAREAEKFNGVMSERTKKIIERIINNWEGAINTINTDKEFKGKFQRRQLVFFTLTLSKIQTDSDRWVKRYLLNTFLSKLRLHFSDFNYLWVAEKQKKNTNNIHFHVLTDRYIDKDLLADLWDDTQAQYGYLTNEKRKSHHSASTEIHAVKGVKSVGAYVSKYIQKDASKLEVEGRLWSCSRSLKTLSNCMVHCSYTEFNSIIDEHSDVIDLVSCNENVMVIKCHRKVLASSILPKYATALEFNNKLNAGRLLFFDDQDFESLRKQALETYYHENYVCPF